MKPKNLRIPPRRLTARKADFAAYESVLFRLHRIEGRHRVKWDQMRTWGPLLSARWDPHPEPVGEYDEAAVMYAATDYSTALGEVFQGTRSITLSPARALVAWTPARPLRLLHLTDTWAMRNGASGSLDSATRSTCRAWARAIHTTWPDLDGLLTHSAITRRPLVTLFAPAGDSFPASPSVTRPLSHPALGALAVAADDELAWPIHEV